MSELDEQVVLKLHRQYGREEAFKAALDAITELQQRLATAEARTMDLVRRLEYANRGKQFLEEKLERVSAARKMAEQRIHAEWKEKYNKLKAQMP